MRQSPDALLGPVPDLLEIVSSVSQEPLCLLTVEVQDSGRHDFRFTWANDAFIELLNVTEDRLLGTTVLDLLPGGGQVYDVLQRVVASGSAQSGELDVHPIIAPSTRIRYRVVTTPYGLAVSLSDRSGEREAQERASWLERLLITGVELSTVSAAILRPIRSDEGAIVDFSLEHLNEIACAQLGRDRDRLVGMRLSEFLKQAPRQGGMIQRIAEAVEAGTPTVFDTQLRGVRLGLEWLRCHVVPLSDIVVIHIDDISERRTAERTLAASEQRYRSLFETANEGVALHDFEGRFTFVNQAFATMLGTTPEELIGRSALNFMSESERSRSIEDARLAWNGEQPRVQRQMLLKRLDGSEFWVFVSTNVSRDLHGEIDGILVMALDIDQRIRAENAKRDLAAALAVAEQNERERIAADLHDGPVQTLTALSMKLGAAGVAHADHPVVAPVLLSAEEAVTSTIGELRMLMFQLTPPDLDSERLGQCLLDRARKLLGASVQVTLHDEIRVYVDDASTKTLFRIAQEAIVNAAKHAHASRVTISLSETRSSLIVEVEDNGVGAHISSFTKHLPGHLGVRGMIDRATTLGGVCDITSAPGQGTSVFIRVPRSPTGVV